MKNTFIDLIIRIKNSYLSKKENAEVGFSNMNLKIAEILKSHNYIKDFKIEEFDGKKKIVFELLYNKNQPALLDVQIISKPGRRLYFGYKEIKPVVGGLGIAIFSTPKGIITDKEAVNNKIGGQLLFKIW